MKDQHKFQMIPLTVEAKYSIKLDSCIGSCNTLNDLSNKVYIANKTRFKSKRVRHDYRYK